MSIVFLFKKSDLVAKRGLSFPRRRESKSQLSSWIPAYAGMTELCAGNEKKEYENINFGQVVGFEVFVSHDVLCIQPMIKYAKKNLE